MLCIIEIFSIWMAFNIVPFPLFLIFQALIPLYTTQSSYHLSNSVPTVATFGSFYCIYTSLGKFLYLPLDLQLSHSLSFLHVFFSLGIFQLFHAGDSRTYEAALFKNMSNFVNFCPNFQIVRPFLPFFWKVARMPLFSKIGPVSSTVDWIS